MEPVTKLMKKTYNSDIQEVTSFSENSSDHHDIAVDVQLANQKPVVSVNNDPVLALISDYDEPDCPPVNDEAGHSI